MVHITAVLLLQPFLELRRLQQDTLTFKRVGSSGSSCEEGLTKEDIIYSFLLVTYMTFHRDRRMR